MIEFDKIRHFSEDMFIVQDYLGAHPNISKEVLLDGYMATLCIDENTEAGDIYSFVRLAAKANANLIMIGWANNEVVDSLTEVYDLVCKHLVEIYDYEDLNSYEFRTSFAKPPEIIVAAPKRPRFMTAADRKAESERNGREKYMEQFNMLYKKINGEIEDACENGDLSAFVEISLNKWSTETDLMNIDMVQSVLSEFKEFGYEVFDFSTSYNGDVRWTFTIDWSKGGEID